MKRYYAVLMIVAVAACGVFCFERPKKTTEEELRLHAVPGRIGAWRKIEDITFEPRVIEVLGTKDVIGRMYKNDKNRVVELVMVRAVNNRSAFHPPEYCMTGTGSKMIGKGVVSCRLSGVREDSLDCNEMLFSRDGKGTLLVSNWYYAGKSATPSFYRQQLKIIGNEVRSGTGAGAVVNVYAKVENNDIDGARQASMDFIRSLAPLLQPLL